MDNNKILIKIAGTLFALSALATVSAFAYSRCSEAVIDHIFDFHLSNEKVMEEVRDMQSQKECRDRCYREHVNELGSSHWSEQEGTICRPD